MSKPLSESIVRAFALITLLTCILSTGCESFTARVMHRLDNDTLVQQVWPRKTKGVPVKLRVPSHAEVAIVETYFLIPGGEGIADRPRTGPRIQTLSANNNSNRILDVDINYAYTEQVFTVDFRRPAAGTLDLLDSDNGLEFDTANYFKSISGSATDETILDITAGLSGLGGGGEQAEAESARVDDSIKLGTDPDSVYKQFKRVIAFQRFDIAVPGWEHQMHAFIEMHLGQCNPPCVIDYPYGCEVPYYGDASATGQDIIYGHDIASPPTADGMMLPHSFNAPAGELYHSHEPPSGSSGVGMNYFD
ncbi:MAG: hypothetical protein AAF456_21405 [Planctomycetota bacterium]